MVSLIRQDCYRATRSYSYASVLRLFLTERPFRPIATLRLWQSARHRAWTRWLCPFLNIAHRGTCHLAGMDLPVRMKVGGGLAINHGWGIVLNDAAVIGRNVTLMQGVTIGRADNIAENGTRTLGGAPIIGDTCWIGPGAVIVGDCALGPGCRVLANSFVMPGQRHVGGSLIGGVPAATIRSGVMADVVNPAA